MYTMQERGKQFVIGAIIFVIGLYLPCYALYEFHFDFTEWYAAPTFIMIILGGLGTLIGSVYLMVAAIFPLEDN